MGRSRMWIVGAIGLLLGAQGARAGTLCDVLEARGVLNPEEAAKCREELSSRPGAEATTTAASVKTAPPSGVAYKVGSGFVWNSAEKGPAGFGDATEKPRFSVTLGNRLQVRYTYLDQDVAGSSASSLFRIRRFKFFLNGNAFYPWLKYKLQADWVGGHDSAANTQRPELDDAYVDVAYFPFAALQVGQFKVPFNRSELTSSGSLQFVDRAITNTRFSLVRDQGVSLHGVLGEVEKPWLEYAAGVFNGNGRNRADKDNSDHMGAARIYWTPLGTLKYSESDLDNSPRPLLGIGAAYVFNVVQSRNTSTTALTRTFPDPTNPEQLLTTQIGQRTTVVNSSADYHRATADIHAKWRGASLLADYFFETRDDKTPRVTTTDTLFGQPPTIMSSLGVPKGTTHTHGLNVQAGYFVIPSTLELAIRYAQVNPDGPANRQEEYRVGVGWFIWQHALKLQADVGSLVYEQAKGPKREDLELRTQLQVIF
ncbi:MAG: OprO/OprP family phosphate-selective porin [Candidatus Binatia bacterium]|nr:OprO/OprP family phosphate-selective porin [Candidatus Binatia bacterium]